MLGYTVTTYIYTNNQTFMGYTGVHVKHIANNGDITNLK